jgi:hypothetical protein
MRSACINFKLHLPHFLKVFTSNHIGGNSRYFDDAETCTNLKLLIGQSMFPINALIQEKLEKHDKLKIKLHVSGIFLQLAKTFFPEAIQSLHSLAETKRVHFVAGTFYNSNSQLFYLNEYEAQVQMHGELIRDLFGVKTVNHTMCKCEQNFPLDYSLFNDAAGVSTLDRIIESLVDGSYDKETVEFESHNNSRLQSHPLLNKLYGLEDLIKLSKDASLLENWRRLQDVAYYNLLGEEERVVKSYLSNMITDLEIRLIKKQVEKMRFRKQFVSLLL